MKKTRKSLVLSIVTLLLCSCMFIGSTLAWFTDSVSNTGNKIQAGTLDVELYTTKATLDNAKISKDNLKTISEGQPSVTYYDISALGENKPLFNYNLWEPGYSTPTGFVVKNNGNLALKYELTFFLVDSKTGLEQLDADYSDKTSSAYLEKKAHLTKVNANSKLENVIEVYQGENKLGTLKDFLDGKKSFTGHLSAGQTFNTDDLKLLMPTTAGNEYENASISFDIRLLATQYTEEYDGFGSNQYDALADEKPDGQWAPIYYKAEQSEEIEVTSGEETVIKTSLVSVTVPADATVILEDGTQHAVTEDDKFRLEVKESETDTAGTKITVAAGQTLKNCEVDLIKIDSSNNETIVTGIVSNKYYGEVSVKDILGVDTLLDLQGFYHKGTALTKVNTLGELDSVGKYFYDQSVNKIKFYTDSFSPYETVFEFAGGQGTEEYPYLIATCPQLKAISNRSNEYFKQIADINTNDVSVVTSPKNIVYDGNNHKIVDIRKNGGNAHYLFDEIEGTCELKNINFYSNEAKLFILCYDGSYGSGNRTSITFDNCDAKTTATGVIETSMTNANLYLINGPDDKNETSYSWIDCDNYVSFHNNSACASVFMAWYATDPASRFKFTNCNNYGEISANQSAGLITGHMYSHYMVTDLETYLDNMIVDNCHNYGIIKAGKNVGMFADVVDGSSNVINAFNNKFSDEGGQYLLTAPLPMNFDIDFNNGIFGVKASENPNNYSFILCLNINSVYFDGGINNTTVVKMPTQIVDSISSKITASKIHCYDKNAAVENGIVDSIAALNFISTNSRYDFALIEKSGIINVVFDTNNSINCGCSLFISGYNADGKNVGIKDY